MECEPWPMKLSGFPRRVQRALEHQKLDYAKRLFSDPENANEIRENVWDLLPLLGKYLTEKARVFEHENFNCCKELSGLLGEISDPEDALLATLAEIESCQDVTLFLALLELFQLILVKLKGKRGPPFLAQESLNMYEAFVVKMPVPSYTNFSEKERLVVDNGLVVSDIVLVVSKVLEVYANLIETNGASWVWTLVALLGKPLSFLNINKHNGVKTEAGVFSEDIVTLIFKFSSDPVALVNNCEPSYRTGLANLIYFIYCEGKCLELCPKVYRAEYMFETFMGPICWLMENSKSEVMLEKALKLAKGLINPLPGHNLSFLYLECDYQKRFFLLLSNEVVLNSEEVVRKSALELLSLYCKCFEVKGLYLLVKNLLKEVSHAGLKGYMINLYKERLVKEFRGDTVPEHFKGAKLRSLLRQFCDLDEDKKMLLEQFDQIVSTLNLLRYLILRDQRNVTGFWDFAPTLKTNYLEPLEACINAHKEDIRKKISEGPASGSNRGDVSVTVDGADLRPLGPQEQLREMQMLLVMCDQLQSLLDRVNELLFVNK
ncbi:glomulin [Anthonomus grandis grandis]|uniref:glomulin n=1 Tax=Anthonomus grandis grandis TaxID=2921223 RepID=UPI0021652F13|nr:glomulin [Anthonomus grandis grandis]